MLGIWDVGPLELGIILLVVLLIFGAKRLPEIARSLGRSSKEFKKGMKEGSDDSDEEEEKKEAETKTD